MKKHLPTILIVLVFVIGLSIMLYPTVSNLYNERFSSYTVSNYNDVIDDTTQEKFEEMLAEARAYNKIINSTTQNYITGDAYDQTYIDTLNVLNGMMGYIVIDKIGVELPIYHGTDEDVLQTGVGHLEGSSLPTGDIGNNTVLTGHTGLPSASLFTNLTEMEIGDTFELYILNKVYTYEVFNIVVVEPYEVDDLEAIDGKDVVTLITCTPYGVNSHRLLVQGEQIEIQEEIVLETSISNDDKENLDLTEYIPYVIGITIVVLLVLIVILLIRKKKIKYNE